MKKFIVFGILFSIVILALTITSISIAKNPDVAPTVSIRSPKDHAVVIGNTLDVEVRFSSKEKGKANVRYIRLELDGNEVGIHQNRANIKDGIHTFHLDITDLSLGEHTLQAFAYQAEIRAGLEGKSPIVIFTKSDIPIPLRIIKDPTATPDGIFVDEPTLVTITAVINPDPDLIKLEITLRRLNELNQSIEFLGYLHDDGLEGDAIAGDNIYTLEVNFDEPQPSEIKLRIFAEYITAPTTISSDIFTVDAIIPISEEDFKTILEVEDAAIQEFERLKERHNDDKARKLTVNWLKRQYGVEDAGISSDNDTIWILFTSGLEGGITTHPAGTRANPQILSTEAPVIPEVVNAIVLAPFFDEFSSKGGDESDYIAQKLSQLWSPTSTIKHSVVTVDLMKTLSQYAVVSITSHGSINSEGQVQIFTGEKAISSSRDERIFDLRTGRTAIKNGYYIIDPSFIRRYGNKYPRSLIYIGACHSMGNNTMSNAFLDKGAYTYFGYDNVVNSPFAYSIGTRLFNYLLENRMTTGEAFIVLGDKVDPKAPHAEFLMAGGDDLVLAEKPVITNESPTGEITDKRPTIQAKIYSPSNIDIDLLTIVMTLDSLAVTPTIIPETGGSDITLTHTPTYDLDTGQHTVVIDAKDAIGLAAAQKTWGFTIAPITGGDWQDVLSLLNQKRSNVEKDPVIVSHPEDIDIVGALTIREGTVEILEDYGFTGLADALDCAGYTQTTWSEGFDCKNEIRDVSNLMYIQEFSIWNLIKDIEGKGHVIYDWTFDWAGDPEEPPRGCFPWAWGTNCNYYLGGTSWNHTRDWINYGEWRPASNIGYRYTMEDNYYEESSSCYLVGIGNVTGTNVHMFNQYFSRYKCSVISLEEYGISNFGHITMEEHPVEQSGNLGSYFSKDLIINGGNIEWEEHGAGETAWSKYGWDITIKIAWHTCNP